jgi:hypothetical protein
MPGPIPIGRTQIQMTISSTPSAADRVYCNATQAKAWALSSQGLRAETGSKVRQAPGLSPSALRGIPHASLKLTRVWSVAGRALRTPSSRAAEYIDHIND